MTTNEVIERLEKLTRECGKSLYERVVLAQRVISDKSWLAQQFHGSEHDATDALNDKYFFNVYNSSADEKHRVLYDLLHILRKYPDEKEWKEKNYNIGKLYATCKPGRVSRGTQKRPTNAELEIEISRNKDLQFKVKELTKVIAKQDGEVVELREKCATLEKENERLKGRIEELERIVARELIRV